MLLDFTQGGILSLSVFCRSCLRGCAGTVNGLLTSVRQLNKYLLVPRDDVDCTMIRVMVYVYRHISRNTKSSLLRRTLRSLEVFISGIMKLVEK